MKTIKEMTDVMLAFDRGEQIERYYDNEWTLCKNPIWNWGYIDYRVKSKLKYVPFDTVEELLEAQKKHGVYIKRIGDDVLFDIYANYYSDHILLKDSKGNIENTLLSILYENYKFFDGTPCGKEVAL